MTHPDIPVTPYEDAAFAELNARTQLSPAPLTGPSVAAPQAPVGPFLLSEARQGAPSTSEPRRTSIRAGLETCGGHHVSTTSLQLHPALFVAGVWACYAGLALVASWAI